jgi:glycosyltransferase involved in cell wall biosynthesis
MARTIAGKPAIVFGMNSNFAVRQFLPEVVAMARKRGFRPIILAPGEPTNEERRQYGRLGIEFRPVPIRREIALISDLWCLLRIWFILVSIKPAITNMSTPKMALLGGLAAWLTRVPRRVYTLRGLRYQTTRSWKRRLLVACERVSCACAHRVICVSRSLKEAVVRDRICAAEKLALLGQTVSEGISIPPAPGPRVHRENLRKTCGIPDGAVVIGFVGRLTRDKGVEDLVACFRILRSQGLPVHLLLL